MLKDFAPSLLVTLRIQTPIYMVIFSLNFFKAVRNISKCFVAYFMCSWNTVTGSFVFFFGH